MRRWLRRRADDLLVAIMGIALAGMVVTVTLFAAVLTALPWVIVIAALALAVRWVIG